MSQSNPTIVYWNPHAIPIPRVTPAQRTFYYPNGPLLMSPFDYRARLPKLLKWFTGDVLSLFPINTVYLDMTLDILRDKGYWVRDVATAAGHWIIAVIDNLCTSEDQGIPWGLADNLTDTIICACVVKLRGSLLTIVNI